MRRSRQAPSADVERSGKGHVHAQIAPRDVIVLLFFVLFGRGVCAGEGTACRRCSDRPRRCCLTTIARSTRSCGRASCYGARRCAACTGEFSLQVGTNFWINSFSHRRRTTGEEFESDGGVVGFTSAALSLSSRRLPEQSLYGACLSNHSTVLTCLVVRARLGVRVRFVRPPAFFPRVKFNVTFALSFFFFLFFQ